MIKYPSDSITWYITDVIIYYDTVKKYGSRSFKNIYSV